MYTNAYEGAIRGVELNKLRFAVILASLMAFSVYLASSASADGFSVYDWVVKFNSVVFGFTGAQVAEDTTAVSSGATGSVATSGGGGELAPVSGTNSSGGGGGSGSAVAKHPPCGSYGDVDGDGSVTNADAELVSSYAAKLAALTDSQLKLADVNADGVVNVVDSLFIAQYLNNLRETFTVCQRKPDLAISEINVYPESGIFEGTEVLFEIIIKNVGAAATVDYSFSYDYGEGVGAGLAYPLNFDAGGSKAERVTHAYNAAGTYTATFSVGASDDSNMANNKAVKSVTVNKAAEVIACTESDNGLDYYVAGKTTGKLLNMDGFSYDYCSEGGVDEQGNPVNLVEFYCINSTDYAPKPYYCPNGCKDGACLNEAVPVRDAAEALLKLGGRSYKIRSVSSDGKADFPVFVDYNGDGAFNAHLPITGRESDSISKNTYFYLWGYGVMQYSGASSFTSASPVIRFRDLKAGTLIEEPYWLKSGSVVIATLKMGGKEYNVSASDTSSADFVIRVDMDGSGVIGDGNKNIINNEVAPVQRNDYVYLVGWGDLVRYKGASAFSDSLHTMKFQDVSTGNLLEIAYSVVNETETPHCIDSDGGKDYYAKGTLKAGPYNEFTDYCQDENYLWENFCSGNGFGGETYYCPYGCGDGACLKETPPLPPDQSFAGTVRLSPGWNLIGTFLLDDDANVKTDCDKSGNVQAAYYYDPVNRRYVDLLAAEAGSDVQDTKVEVRVLEETKTAPDEMADSKSYLMLDKVNSFWIKVADGCEINFELEEPYGWLSEVGNSGKKLARGWNFLSIIPEMAGRNIGSLDGTCSFTRAYRFDQESQSWQNIRDVTFSWEMVGVGYAVKVADECVIDGIIQEEPANTPPELPAE